MIIKGIIVCASAVLILGVLAAFIMFILLLEENFEYVDAYIKKRFFKRGQDDDRT